MKAISLWQPWASALFAPHSPEPFASALKTNETRSWPLPKLAVGVPIAIQAAKRDTPDERDFWLEVVMHERFRETFGVAFEAIGIKKYSDLPRGCIIGVVEFAPPVRVEQLTVIGEIERELGNYSLGRWAWPVVKTEHFATPRPCVGRQGFFDWEPGYDGFESRGP